jgi:hypothetical protein
MLPKPNTLAYNEYFRVGATFEMRTTLCGIHLLIDNMIMNNRVYIRKQTVWGESKIVERQRERGREAERC